MANRKNRLGVYDVCVLYVYVRYVCFAVIYVEKVVKFVFSFATGSSSTVVSITAVQVSQSNSLVLRFIFQK